MKKLKLSQTNQFLTFICAQAEIHVRINVYGIGYMMKNQILTFMQYYMYIRIDVQMPFSN